MPVLINILPNVYWMYNNPNASISENEYNIDLKLLTLIKEPIGMFLLILNILQITQITIVWFLRIQ